MTSTKTFGGIDSNARNSSKVLKPPGGGSSDIFGTSSSAPEAAGTPGRRVKNHQASNVFLSDEPDNKVAMTPGRNAGQGRDTYSRLFGTPPPAPPSASKNRMRSNILLAAAAQEEDAVNQNSVEPELEEAANGVSVEELDNTDTAHMNGGSGGSENSLNGLGGGGDEPPARLTNGNPSGAMNGNPPSGQQTPARARVPPGGFSSGLW